MVIGQGPICYDIFREISKILHSDVIKWQLYIYEADDTMNSLVFQSMGHNK